METFLSIQTRDDKHPIIVNTAHIVSIYEGPAGAIFRLADDTSVQTRYPISKVQQYLSTVTSLLPLNRPLDVNPTPRTKR